VPGSSQLRTHGEQFAALVRLCQCAKHSILDQSRGDIRMTMQETGRVIREWVDALTRDDPGAFRACLAPEVHWMNMADGRVVHGAEPLHLAIWGMRVALPDLYARIDDMVADGDRAAVEMTFTGTHNGQLIGPAGPVPPTGNQVSLRAALFFHVQDGRIVRITRYGDTLSLLTQVGLRPAFQPA